MILARGPVYDRLRDGRALHLIYLSSILGLVSAVVGVGTTVLNAVSPIVTAGSATSGLTLSFGPLVEWVVLLGLGGGFAVVWILLVRAGMETLAPIDSRFSSPATLGWFALVGIVLVFVGLGVFLEALQSALGCAGTGTPVPTSCFLGGWFLGGIAVLAIGGVLALIGYIGLLLGIWRLGGRYHDEKFQVGAILFIFPLLNIVGQILILMATGQAASRLGSQAPPTGAVP